MESIKQVISKITGQVMLELAHETAKRLLTKQSQLQLVKWSDGESNTDTEFSILACASAEEAWVTVKERHPALTLVTLQATKPDINCTFGLNGELYKDKIELKSSAATTMPGSTIGKLNINEPIIYCFRPKKPDEPFNIRCGQYFTAMGSSDTDLFQDRTPRPTLSFDKLSAPMDHTEIKYVEKSKEAWITHYAKCAVNRLNTHVNSSWQDEFTKQIIFEAIKDGYNDPEKMRKLFEFVRTA
jgi:hypothetical protein